MDQIKIGKFIAQVRKEREMTHLELANRLAVTDRAVSKWENGRGMPEISLIKPLCNELEITINELFCGERIETENIDEIAEENIVNTLNYSHKKIKKTKMIFSIILAVVISISVFYAAMFAIDVNRMRNNRPVFFSTWGIDYAPPVDLKEEKIQIAIKDYLVTHGDNEEKHIQNVKTFVAFNTYLLEENDNEFYVYAWILQEQCYVENNDVMNYGSFSMPYKFTVKEENNSYIVTESRFPRDGTYYSEDMKNIFPKSVINSMNSIHKDGTFERLELHIQEQVELYFHDVYAKYN